MFKNCGQKKIMQQSSTSRYHLKTKQPLDFSKLTKLTAEQEEKRGEDLKEIQEATVYFDEAQNKVGLYTLFLHDKQRAMGTQKTLAEFDLGKYPSQRNSQWGLTWL